MSTESSDGNTEAFDAFQQALDLGLASKGNVEAARTLASDSTTVVHHDAGLRHDADLHHDVAGARVLDESILGLGSDAGGEFVSLLEDAGLERAPIPKQIGRYVVEALMRGGGMGALYRARDPSTAGRLVVLKTLKEDRSRDSRLLDRLREEARLGSKFLHAGICPVLDVVEEKGTVYLVLPFIEGESLEELLRKARDLGSPPPSPRSLWNLLREAGSSASASEVTTPRAGSERPDRAQSSTAGTLARRPSMAADPALPESRGVPAALLVLLENVARAVDHMNAAGVIHRDLKPGNILIQKNGAPIVIDFGLALETDENRARLTREGEVLGTPAYMAPEQIEGRSSDIDRRTDVWALGVILYELLTLRLPFSGGTHRELLARTLRGDPVPPRQLVPEIPRDLEAVCLQALEVERDRRYATAAEFADDLRRFRKREATLARPLTTVEFILRRMRRHAWAIAGAAALIALAGVATFLVIELGAEREKTTTRVVETQGAFLSFENLRRAAEEGREPSPSDLDRVKHYVRDREELDLVVSDPYSPRSWEIFVRGVETETLRADDQLGVVLVSPRGQVVVSAEGPIVRLLRGSLPESVDWHIILEAEDSDSGASSRRDFVLPRTARDVTERWGAELVPGLWTITARIDPARHGGASETFADSKQSVLVVSSSERDRALAAFSTSGSDDDDRLLRAVVLQRADLEFYEDALAELDAISPTAPKGARVRADLLEARILWKLGDLDGAAALEESISRARDGANAR
jgi:serine/threonine protein kinase